MGYSLGAVKPFVADVANTVGPKFRIGTIYGWRATAADMQGHPAGLALDFVVGSDRGKGDQLAAFLQANAATLHIKYLIWQQRYWEPGGKWSKMEYRPGATAGYDPNHLRHVHASFKPDVANGQGLSVGGLVEGITDAVGGVVGGVGNAAETAVDVATAPARLAAKLFERETWLRVLYVLGGAGMITNGVVFIVLGLSDTKVGKTVTGIIPQTRAATIATSIAEGASK